VRRWALRLALAYAAASLAAGIVLGEFAVHRGRLLPGGGDARAHAEAVARSHGAALEPVRVDGADGVALHGWLFTGAPSPRPTVLVTHGSGGSRDHATAYAAFLLEAGFDVLAPDARGHGESGGVGTFGLREADDLQRWAALARARTPDRCVFALGTSLGAAQVLMAEAGRPTFCGIVSDSAYATFVDAGLDRIARPLRLGAAGRWIGRPAAAIGLAYVHLRYDIDLAEARPADAIARIRAPLLLIHGDADLNTPLYHARALARAQPEATLWVVPGAWHTGAWRAQPREFPRRIVAFFRQRG
jgi:dipeptidyl aminopeptidase/acylaminoacyl peptidase